MRLNRFQEILLNLYLNYNLVLEKEDRFYELRPLILRLNVNSKYLYGGLEETLTIDESMIPYYGKNYAKQYNKGKHIRFGFKHWALFTSNGYMVVFDLYTV